MVDMKMIWFISMNFHIKSFSFFVEENFIPV